MEKKFIIYIYVEAEDENKARELAEKIAEEFGIAKIKVVDEATGYFI